VRGRRGLLGIVAGTALAFGFAWGFLSHRKKVFPYYALRRAASLAGVPLWTTLPPPSPLRPQTPAELHSVSRVIASLITLPYAHGQIDPRADLRGVVVNRAGAVWPGLNFYSTVRDGKAFLVDNDGKVRWRWQLETGEIGATKDTNFAYPHLFPNGDVLVFSHDGPLVRLDRHSRLLWKSAARIHHAAWTRPDGTIYAISHESRRVPELHPGRSFRLDTIVVMGPDGRQRKTISLYDVFRRSPFRFLMPSLAVAYDSEASAELDLFHTNNVEVFEGAPSGNLYRAGNILVSLKNIHTVAILDGETHAILWLWGPTNLAFQHSPTLLPTGNVLVFNNFSGGARRSSIEEVDPRTDRVAWRYAPEGGFFSNISGACQRLPNGNTLITESQTGYAFEVTPKGEVAWRFANPSVDPHGLRQAIYRMKRYSESELVFAQGPSAGG